MSKTPKDMQAEMPENQNETVSDPVDNQSSEDVEAVSGTADSALTDDIDATVPFDGSEPEISSPYAPKKGKRDENALTGEPMPKDAPRNRFAWYATISIFTGTVLGLIVPVIGFIFYIMAGIIALIFSLASVFAFRSYGLPGTTVGTLICSAFLLLIGIIQILVFPMFVGMLYSVL